MSDKLLFKLKAGKEPEEGQSEEVARAVASLIHAPAFRAAEAAGAVVGSFTLQPSPFVAEAVAAAMHQAREQGELMRQAVAANAAAFIPAVEALGNMAAQATAAVGEFMRPDGYFAQFVRQAEEARAALFEWYRLLPEEEREAIRRAYEDMPLEEVDVNANSVGVM